LVRLPNPLGDVVMATPLLRSLRNGLPGTRIVVAGKAPYAELLAGLDSFDSFLPLDATTAHADVLREAAADVALLLPNSWSSVIAAWRAGIPRRIGRRNQLRSLLLHRSLPPIPGAAPMTELYADFLPTVGLEREVLSAELMIEAPPATERPAGNDFIGVAPGAAFGPSKCYPHERLIEALESLHRERGLVPIWLGSPDERAQLQQLASALSFESIFPAADGLDEAKALIGQCKCIVAMDNGARHMAAALGIPQVVVYGPTHPAWSAHSLGLTTILRRDELDCLNCHHKTCPKDDHPCMTRIASTDLVAAVSDVLA